MQNNVKTLWNFIKKVKLSVKESNKEKAVELLNAANKKVDKAVSNGLIHKNKAARKKSQLTVKLNSIDA